MPSESGGRKSSAKASPYFKDSPTKPPRRPSKRTKRDDTDVDVDADADAETEDAPPSSMTSLRSSQRTPRASQRNHKDPVSSRKRKRESAGASPTGNDATIDDDPVSSQLQREMFAYSASPIVARKPPTPKKTRKQQTFAVEIVSSEEELAELRKSSRAYGAEEVDPPPTSSMKAKKRQATPESKRWWLDSNLEDQAAKTEIKTKPKAKTPKEAWAKTKILPPIVPRSQSKKAKDKPRAEDTPNIIPAKPSPKVKTKIVPPEISTAVTEKKRHKRIKRDDKKKEESSKMSLQEYTKMILAKHKTASTPTTPSVSDENTPIIPPKAEKKAPPSPKLEKKAPTSPKSEKKKTLASPKRNEKKALIPPKSEDDDTLESAIDVRRRNSMRDIPPPVNGTAIDKAEVIKSESTTKKQSLRTPTRSEYFKATTKSSTKAIQSPTKSPHFPSRPAKNASAIIPPPLSAEKFGLIQEEFAHNPYHLLIATIFLNKVRGAVSIPYFRKFVERYSTPQSLLEKGSMEEVVEFMRPLGLQTHRAKNVWSLAKSWVTDDPYEKQKGELSWKRKAVYKPDEVVYEIVDGLYTLIENNDDNEDENSDDDDDSDSEEEVEESSRFKGPIESLRFHAINLFPPPSSPRIPKKNATPKKAKKKTKTLKGKIKWKKQFGCIIGHLDGVGCYALDSWRIFCQKPGDGGYFAPKPSVGLEIIPPVPATLPTSKTKKGKVRVKVDVQPDITNGQKAYPKEWEPGDEEWRRVVPADKELRAYLKWMWAKEGVEWDPPMPPHATSSSSAPSPLVNEVTADDETDGDES